MKKANKLISVVLCLAMIFSLMPASLVMASEKLYSYSQDFTEMEETDIVRLNTGNGLCWYTNGSYDSKTNSKYEIAEENGNKFLKLTAADKGGGGYVYINLNDSTILNNSVVEVSFRFKIDSDPNETYSKRVFEAQGTGLLTQQNSYFYTGWGADRSPIGVLYNNYGWNTMKYTLDLNSGTVYLKVNDTDYGQMNLGEESLPKAIEYFRFNPSFDDMKEGRTITVCYDDLVIREIKTVDLYVSASATESGDGTLANPYTLAKAQSAVRTLVSSGTATDINVYLRGGTYYLNDGLTFSNLDSKASCPVTYASYNGEKAILTNAVSLNGSAFGAVTDKTVLSRIPEAAQNSVVQANLNDLSVSDLGTLKKNRYMTFEENSSPILTVNNKMQTLSRWPNAGWAFQGKILGSGEGYTASFRYTDEVGDRWSTATDAWYHGFGYYLWADESSPVSFDTENKEIKLQNSLAYGLLEGRPYYIYNLIEELDAPGEWYLDRSTGILYIYPEENLASAKITYATSDKAVISLNNASNLTFRDIVVEGTCAEGVEIKNNSCYNTIDNCELRNLGMVGVDIESGSRENKITNSHFHDLCKTGINIKESSADFTTLEPTNNVVENCHIENFGKTSYGYMAGIRVYGIGNKIAHNRINGGKHLAIYLNGNDNIIEYNDIYNVMNSAEDMAAIYCWSDWTNLGHKVRYNSIHNISGPVDLPNRTHRAHAIYFDDAASNANIYGNVIANADAGVYTNGGSYHNVSNNIFINTDAFAVNMYNWSSQTDDTIVAANTVLMNSIANGDETWEGYGDIINHKYRQSYWEEKYPIGKAAYDAKYEWLPTFLSSDPFIPKHNTLKGNVSIGANNKTYGKAFRTSGLVDTYGTVSDNLLFPDGLALVNEANGNYNVADYSAITASLPQFETLDVTKTGPTEESGLSVGEFSVNAPYVSDVASQEGRLMFSWEASSGADKYRLQIATDSSFNDIVYDEETGYTFKLVDGIGYTADTYYWRVAASSTSHAYTGSLYNSDGVQTLALTDGDGYRYTQDFTLVTRETLPMDVSEFNNVSPTDAYYDIVSDPDSTSGQGKVLKMFVTPSKMDKRLWYTLGESVTGIVKIGFKVKIDKEAGASPKGCILRTGGSYLIGINGDEFCVGWGSNTDSLASAQKTSGWNDFTLYLDVDNDKMLAVDLNGTRFTGDAVNGSQYGFGYMDEVTLSKLNFAPTQFALSSNMITYYDDITIEEIPNLKLVSSSVENGDTNVPWVNSIELVFDKEIDASTAGYITLTQNGASIPVSVSVNGKRVLVRHKTLDSNAQCTLTIPSTVAATDTFTLGHEEKITYAPADAYTVDIDFENMETSDLTMGNSVGSGIDFYSLSQYTGKPNSKVEIVEESGNKVLKFTNNDPGSGYLFLPLGQTFSSGLVEVSFKTKMGAFPSGAYIANWFEFYPNINLLGQKFGKVYCGWDTAGATEITSLSGNTDWNTLRYIVDFDNDKVYFVVNEGTEKEARYHEVTMGSNDISKAALTHLRLGPTYTGGEANQNYTAYYDDIVVKRIPTPTSGLLLEGKTVEGTPSANADVTIKATFGNGTAAFKNPVAVAALYAENGKLKEVKKASIKLWPTENATAKIIMTMPADYASTDKIRVFGIESFNSLRPLGESK